MVDPNSDLQARCTAIVRDEVRSRWRQSGFGRSEPPPPVLRVEHCGDDGTLRISTEPDGGWSWVFPWDGSDGALMDWLEIVAEEYWGDYCDPTYKDWRPPDQ